jgi:hypothetical protein
MVSDMWAYAIILWATSFAFLCGCVAGFTYSDRFLNWVAIRVRKEIIATQPPSTPEEGDEPKQGFSAVSGRVPWAVRRRQLEKQFAAENQEAV